VDPLYRFAGRLWIDIGAILSSALVLVGGSYLAWTVSPVWLNRAGSVIIVIGLVVAALRFHEWFDQKVSEFVSNNYSSVLNDAIDEIIGEEELSISGEDRVRLHSLSMTKTNDMLSAVIARNNHRMQIYEIYLVIAGTLLNGFGDYVVCGLKICH